jgi:hypothetical protein
VTFLKPLPGLRVLTARGLVLRPEGGRLRYRYPRHALHPADLDLIRLWWQDAQAGDPEALVAFAEVLLGPLAPGERTWAGVTTCRACRGRSWWRRPPHLGGGWVCAVCHPAPPGVEPAAWYPGPPPGSP